MTDGFAQALYQGSDTELQRPHVAHVINLQKCVGLGMMFHDVAYLILDKRVGTTTKGGHLNEMDIVGLFSTPLTRLDDAVHVSPLAHEISISRASLQVAAYDIIGDDIHA